MWRGARLAPNVSSFGCGPKEAKKVEKRRVKGGCVESGSDRGGELARSKDTADPRNRGTSSYSPGVPFFSFGTPG